MDRSWFAPFLDTAPDAGPEFCRVRKSVKNGLVLSIGAVQKAIETDDSKLMVRSVISTPCLDLQGDSVDPDGFDTSYHQQVRTVLLDHGQDYPLPVGLAEEPNTKGYTVRRAGDLWIADTYFKPDRIGEQLYDLVKSDYLRGWSATFIPTTSGVPLGPFNKSLKRCPMRFPATKLLEYSVTPNPINPEALTILAAKGAAGKLDSVIMKSFGIGEPGTRNGVVVPDHPLTSVSKAMSDDAGYGAGAGGGEMSEPTHTAKTSYDGAQGYSDITDHLEQELTKCEHIKGKKNLKKCIDRARELVEDLKANGDMVSSDMDDQPEEQDKMVDEPDPVERSATGLIVIKKALYEPVRWTTKDVAAALGLSQPAPEQPTRKSRAERDAEKLAEREERERKKAVADYLENARKFPQLFASQSA